ncbi:MAG: hypothetical protein K2L18_09420 [Acetatifactor sp.]|nr:hypothetical protein [Acetatifactor sp.]
MFGCLNPTCVVVPVCPLAISRIAGHMNISKALKLGEDLCKKNLGLALKVLIHAT